MRHICTKHGSIDTGESPNGNYSLKPRKYYRSAPGIVS